MERNYYDLIKWINYLAASYDIMMMENIQLPNPDCPRPAAHTKGCGTCRDCHTNIIMMITIGIMGKPIAQVRQDAHSISDSIFYLVKDIAPFCLNENETDYRVMPLSEAQSLMVKLSRIPPLPVAY
jgi:hypothetical protein